MGVVVPPLMVLAVLLIAAVTARESTAVTPAQTSLSLLWTRAARNMCLLQWPKSVLAPPFVVCDFSAVRQGWDFGSPPPCW